MRRAGVQRLLTLALTLVMPAAGMAAATGDVQSRSSDYDYDAPVPGSYNLPVIKAAGDGALLEATGKEIRLSELTHGRITVLSFIYTRCAAAKACPYATNVLGAIQAATVGDKTLAENLRLVSLSFDPGHDTPQRLAEYAQAAVENKSGCEWRFATAKSPNDLNQILAEYGQAVDRRPNAADPQGPLYHVMRVFLIDAGGRVRNIYGAGTLDRRLVLADVKTLLLEGKKAEAKIANAVR